MDLKSIRHLFGLDAEGQTVEQKQAIARLKQLGKVTPNKLHQLTGMSAHKASVTLKKLFEDGYCSRTKVKLGNGAPQFQYFIKD